MMNKKILIFHPDIYKHHTSNEHHINVYKTLEKYREVHSFEWFLKHPFNRNIDTMFLNWYENTLSDKKNITVEKIQYFIKKIILLFAQKRGIRIIYAFHNKAPHNVEQDSNLYKNIVKPFMSFCFKHSDRVIVLSKSSIPYITTEFPDVDFSNKLSFIPHGIYPKLEYEKDTILSHFGIKGGMLLVILGQMGKYKNTDIAIQAFINSKIQGTLLLAGSCSKEYEAELRNQCGNNENILIFANHISNDEYSALMQIADIAILPYENTSLNSGVMINAFSNGTSVIATRIEMLMDYPEELVYSYSYHNDAQHIEALACAMKKAESDYINGTLKKKGKRLEELVNLNNNWTIVEEAFRRELDEK